MFTSFDAKMALFGNSLDVHCNYIILFIEYFNIEITTVLRKDVMAIQNNKGLSIIL